MTAFPAARKGSRELITSIRFKDFDVSWAGRSFRKDWFCFGSEDGRILLADVDGIVKEEAVEWAPSKEAINGVAFIQGSTSVSTRNELKLIKSNAKEEATPAEATIHVGAHGVIAGIRGYFFAPLGRTGLLACQATASQAQAVIMNSVTIEHAYFYRVISLQASGGQEIVACAIRRGGVAAMEFKGDERPRTLSTLTFDGLDVVDLCPLGPEAAPEGAVAVGRDGTLILIRNVLRDDRPRTVKYESVTGTAYRILSARGYLFLLTSKGLYVIAGLIDRFLKGGAIDSATTPGLCVPMEAVDANLGSDQWLWIVMADGVLRFDVELLDHMPPPDQANGGPKGGDSRERPLDWQPQVVTRMTPPWQRREVEQSSRPLLTTV